jgi:acyl-CoA thioesterase FadM
MNLVIRLLRILIWGLFGRRLDPLGRSIVAFRVWPNDLDINIHMNNGRYLSIMDLGRLDLMLRSGFLRTMLKRRWGAVLGSVTIRYRRPLLPFQRYDLVTRILGWDEKWVFIEQQFVRDGQVCAVGYSKAILMAAGKPLPMAGVLAALGYTYPSPRLPDGIHSWLDAERDLANAPRARTERPTIH